MDEKVYDVVVVGAGVCGTILAKVLGDQGKKVLILEAGQNVATTFAGFQSYLETFYTANIKVPNSPFPNNPNAPQPSVLDVQPIHGHTPNTLGYFVQKGPQSIRSDYIRAAGGTTLHWLGTCLRMLPEDFEIRSRYGHGLNWPISYEDLMPYYSRAEGEIGVAANVEEQQFLGVHFEPGYVYPMFKIPQSYLDKTLANGLQGMTIEFDGETYPIRVVSTPQGRNGMPNPAYAGGKGYRPVGAVGRPEVGQRCAGNANCIPICPIQAKYNALKTMAKANPQHVTLKAQAVASKILFDPATGQVIGIEYKAYHDPNSPVHTSHIAQGKIYVLAAHTVENAKLLLASEITSTSGLVGENLMDHATIITWGLMPQNVGTFRGPSSTSDIPTLRGGNFRHQRAPFRLEIGNWGWNWPTNSPYSLVSQWVDQNNSFGTQLRQQIAATTSRQIAFDFLLEQLPETRNRVTLDPAYRDPLGNYRPVITYHVSDYTRAGMAAAKYTSDLIFQRLGVEDYTVYDPGNPGYVTYQNQGYVYFGANHFAGTHIMGTTKHNSVVDTRQRSWDHPNLFLTGCGNFPTIGTSNPTLTMAALAFWAADNILEDLSRS